MDVKQIINKIEEMLEVEEDSLKMDTILKNIEEWDSMAAVSFLALADEDFSKTVKPSDLKASETIGDLVKLLLN